MRSHPSRLLRVAALAIPIVASCLQIPVAGGATLRLQYENDRLTAEIESVPLREILSALQQSLGLRVYWIDSSSAELPVSVSFERVAVNVGIERILRGFSYIYSVDRSNRMVHVLASRASREFMANGGGRSPTAPTRVEMVVNGQSMAMPESGGTSERPDLFAQAMSDAGSRDDESQLSGVRQLAALVEVEGSAAAVDALQAAALGSAGSTQEASIEAAIALSKNALSESSTSKASLAALQRIATSQSETVRDIAVNALAEIKQREVDGSVQGESFVESK